MNRRLYNSLTVIYRFFVIIRLGLFIKAEIPYGNREDHVGGMTLFQDVACITSLLVVYDSPAKTRLVGDDSVTADVFQLG